MPARWLSILNLLLLTVACVLARTPTQDGVTYGKAGGEKLTMDYYAPSGAGPHPVAIIIHGGGFVEGTSKNGSEAYCADFLAPAGYSVFSINYRLAPKYPYPAMLHDVERAIRFIRHNSSQWNADPERIALVGGSAGGYLSNLAGLLNAPGDKSAADPVDRESASVQAVVTLFGPSDFRGHPVNKHVEALLGAAIREKGEAAALAEAVPFSESTNLQDALQTAGVRADLIRIPNGPHATGSWYKVSGVPEWERQMTEWLNEVLHHNGPIGAGIRQRQPEP